MNRQGWMELLTIGIAVAMALQIARSIANWIPDKQRRSIGRIALLDGVGLGLFGILISAVAVELGVLLAVGGIAIMFYKGSSRRKCLFCAEMIETKAKICRHCGRALEVSTSS